MDKVEIVTESGCWIFMGFVNPAGYGRIGIGSTDTRLVHRFTYDHFVGLKSPDEKVLHRCDVPACCNPYHLFAGTQTDNIIDMRNKGRGSSPPLHLGEKVHCAKLTVEEVLTIRSLLDKGETGVSLARRFGVSTSAISAIRTNKKWRHAA
jgi:hypothetical protein